MKARVISSSIGATGSGGCGGVKHCGVGLGGGEDGVVAMEQVKKVIEHNSQVFGA